ncbi:D-alanine--D-alanine ligase [Polaribacter sp.]|uniref:D-alanine--D-alanine ligase n=1 Tax=Polaribacter sp. TaxID=1920175 RepID=UPI003EF66135
MRTLKNTVHKILNWEYWNTNVIYFPIFFYWIFLSIKARSLGFFNASNPKIINGGFALESKKEIYDLIPNQYYPDTLFFKAHETLGTIKKALESTTINFPFIIKPDIGLQGLRVEKINSWKSLDAYLLKTNYDFLVQKCINYPLEIGVFYYRIPNQKQGVISGIVNKEFLIVTGNGKNTVHELIEQNPRFALQLATLKKKYGNKLNDVLPINAQLNLVPFGNHVRGSKFTDVSHRVNEKLLQTINNICLQIPDFYFGRLDIMFQSWKDIEQGKNFSIIELNGAGSEPTHIYDPKHSIFFAWKEIIRHYDILYKISTYNHQKGYSYLNIKQSRQLVVDNKRLTNYLKSIS